MKWNEKEIDFLKSNYIKLTYNELASSLNRNKKSIGWKLTNLELKKTAIVSISKILKNYYTNNPHHTKGIPKSKKQKRKMGEARRKYLEITSPEILNKIYK